MGLLMFSKIKPVIFCCFFLLTFKLNAKIYEITPNQVHKKVLEIMKAHANYKNLSPELIKRIYLAFLDELDPNKTYLIESDIQPWLEPTNDDLNRVLIEMNQQNYEEFEKIHKKMVQAIARKRNLIEKINSTPLPKKVKAQEFKDMKWAKNEDELFNRLLRIKSLQIDTAAKLDADLREKSLQRIEKVQNKFENELLSTPEQGIKSLILTYVLKAVASSLDTHTAYFTPDEAAQFLIVVQQRLFGIGAQLRDDLNGFTVVKIVEGGPAAEGKELKAKDRIIAVNGEPVVGMDIVDAVELIRGQKNTPVDLTVIREKKDGDEKEEEQLTIRVMRGEVVLKETRYESSTEPFADGSIGYLRLYSFYQDPESSSATDLAKAIEEMKKENNLKGIILDLRYNTGGMLSQAVAVTGLFIKKGIVVSIKDDSDAVQHLRNLEGQATWDGPLIVLTNRASASASEIVAGTLQDYGRALIVGDDHTYGKGSFQTFTLTNSQSNSVNQEGEFKVTRGRYYTVSGKSPQLTGVFSDIVAPGAISEMEIGEVFGKYPLQTDKIKDNFDDDLSDIPYLQRERVKYLYKFDLQQKLDLFTPYYATLKKNSETRIKNNKNYQTFLKNLKNKDEEDLDEEEKDNNKPYDYQLAEAYNIMKDLLMLMQLKLMNFKNS